MTDTASLASIPDDELKKDLMETIVDIAVCRRAIEAGVTSCLSGTCQVLDRLETNLKIEKAILAEMGRRVFEKYGGTA